MSIDEQKQHVALPRLYGQPAYARPPRSFAASDRPPDPDDLPLDVVQTEEEREMAEQLRGGTWAEARAKGTPAAQIGGDGLRPRPFSLRTIGRLFGVRE
ncbi:MAG TPA: hypothetical protein VFS32_03885 [Candidatus Limnocylindrales bacterium]|nr:hypothetical protein [Candidatus Limnocylindrales bacterium]